MKKLLLLAALLGMFAVPVLAAEDAAVYMNGSRWDLAKRDIRHIFDGDGRRMFAVRWMAGQCGIHEKSGGNAIRPMKAIAEGAGLEMRWDRAANTAYFMEKERVLYENEEFGIGVLLPEGGEDCYSVLEAELETEGQTGRHFVVDFCWEGNILFYLAYFDLDDWENAVRENFPIAYSEVYRNQDGIWLCVNVSDVQVDAGDAERRAEYERLLSYREEICASFYTFTE